jgi:hypothetical protein
MAFLKGPSTKRPPTDVIAERRAWFAAFNAEARDNSAWVISLSGAKEVVIECLPTSAWPAVIAKRGYNLKPEPDGEKILATAIREPMGINTDGTLGPLTPSSTRLTTMVAHHPGVHETRRFSFKRP